MLVHQGSERFVFITILLVLAVIGAVVISTGMGYIEISPLEVLRIIAARLSGAESLLAGLDPVWPMVVMDVRLEMRR